MNISKEISVTYNTQLTPDKIISFWKSRGFSLKKSTGTTFIFKRGNLIGDLFSYNMKHLINKLTINILPNNKLSLEMNILALGRPLTSLNEEYWHLEMKTFEYALLSNNYLEKEWEDYLARTKVSSIIWTLGIIAIFVILIYLYVKNRLL